MYISERIRNHISLVIIHFQKYHRESQVPKPMNAAELLPFKATQSFSFFDKSTGPLHKCNLFHFISQRELILLILYYKCIFSNHFINLIKT